MDKKEKKVKKELTEEEVNELADLSGENNVKTPKKLNLATIKLNGKDGKFYKNEMNDEGKFEQTEIQEEVTGVVLKIRRVLTAYRKEQGKSYILFTNQHNSWKDKVVLFEKKEGERAKLKDKGMVPEIREKYPELRVRQVVYFLLYPGVRNEVVKLVIRGKGLSSLFQFFNEFENDEHLFEYEVKVGVQREEGDLGEYYFNVFEKLGGVSDIELVQEKIKEIASAIEEFDNHYKQKDKEMEEQFSEGNIDYKEKEKDKTEDSNIPVVEDDDEIDVNDIPF